MLARYDASLLEIDVADKGSVFIVALGAPVAHEDDAERGLLCALELLGLAPEVTTIGVNTGLAFCGYVGSPVRRAYSVFGDTVNTAARVMAASRAGQVLAAAATQDRAGGRFAWERRRLWPRRERRTGSGSRRCSAPATSGAFPPAGPRWWGGRMSWRWRGSRSTLLSTAAARCSRCPASPESASPGWLPRRRGLRVRAA